MKAPPADVRDEASALIAEVGRRAEDARRYRELATTLAEPVFDRAIAIGSAIRQADRLGRAEAIGAAIEELRILLRKCEDAIRNVQSSAPYRDLVAAHAAGLISRTTELAAVIFAGVVSEPSSRAVHWAVPLTARRGQEHFIRPDQCLARIREIATHGIAAPADIPDIGGDEVVRPIRLSEAAEGADSPITLAFAAEAFSEAVGRIPQAELTLWYAQRLHAPFTVHAAETVSDEWWEIRPAAYAEYVSELRRAVTAAGLTMTGGPASTA